MGTYKEGGGGSCRFMPKESLVALVARSICSQHGTHTETHRDRSALLFERDARQGSEGCREEILDGCALL